MGANAERDWDGISMQRCRAHDVTFEAHVPTLVVDIYIYLISASRSRSLLLTLPSFRRASAARRRRGKGVLTELELAVQPLFACQVQIDGWSYVHEFYRITFEVAD